MTIALEAGLVGRDPETLCRFYTATMGFVLVERLRFDVGTVYKFRRDAAQLKIFFSTDPLDPIVAHARWFQPGGWRYAALHLECPDDVDDLVAAVAATGGSVLIAPTNHRPDARMALVTDPEGNAWELSADVARLSGDSSGR